MPRKANCASCWRERPIPRFRRKQEPPRRVALVLDEAPGSVLLLHGLSHTTIGAGAFHFRVRDGIGWDHTAMAARERVRMSVESTRHSAKGRDVTSACDSIEPRRVIEAQACAPCAFRKVQTWTSAFTRRDSALNLLVFEGPSGALRPGRSHLGARFPLRCFQRLSLPYIATRQCHWHDNRNTSGTSTPVLSY